MDRFKWCSDHQVGYREEGGGSSGMGEESLVSSQDGVRLYDGPKRTAFSDGFVKLTTHRLIWSHQSSHDSSPSGFIALPLAAILQVKVEEGGLLRNKTPKLVLSLLTLPSLVNALDSLPRPLTWMTAWNAANPSEKSVVASSSESHVKLGFTRAGHYDFNRALNETLQAKLWALASSSKPLAPSSSSLGITAIARQQAARAGATDRAIEEAFDDLSQLMKRAGEMVALSNSLAKRVRASNGSDDKLSGDETVQLRSLMLSVGMANGSDDSSTDLDQSASSTGSFHRQLAHQLAQVIGPMLEKKKQRDSQSSSASSPSRRPIGSLGGAGCIDLASAYCWINRARGLQLISPDDLLAACQWLKRDNLPIRLKRFPSGLLILQLASENEEATLVATSKLLSDCYNDGDQKQKSSSGLTAEELARLVGISPLLAKERLLAVEQAGQACRDDTESGLRFFPNLFLSDINNICD